jgi:lipopolysaccharide transport system ATP-binding protein
MRPIIKVESLGKRYELGHRENYRTFREALIRMASAPFRGAATRFRGEGRPAAKGNHIWALQGVDFDVMPGEILGVIGRNGAGKSTLLKVLSRITEPTTGRVELFGRVGSLLEVGTGFHPELTGRENIFLNGAILGMRRVEIERKFGEIVAFAEVEKFLDTPVKRYSSGMYVRLAFAVAAYMDPEILLVDEVLAVGDAAFQKRCLGRMGDIAREGRTIVFISHNMASIESLCSSCLLINGGKVEAKGRPSEIIERYLAAELRPGTGRRSLRDHQGRAGGSFPMMNSVTLYSNSDGPLSCVPMGSPLSVRVEFSSSTPVRPTLAVTFKTAQGALIFTVSNRWTHQGVDGPRVSAGAISCDFESLPLMPGTYTLDLFLGDFGDVSRDLDAIRDAISIEMLPADVYGTGHLPVNIFGPVFCSATWAVSDRHKHAIAG